LREELGSISRKRLMAAADSQVAKQTAALSVAAALQVAPATGQFEKSVALLRIGVRSSARRLASEERRTRAAAESDASQDLRLE
jgi:hypothetical protein